jgi:hypothetical protein
MRKKTFRELIEGDVFRVANRKYVVASDPVTERGVTRFETELLNSQKVGETSSFSTDDAQYWGRVQSLRVGLRLHSPPEIDL